MDSEKLVARTLKGARHTTLQGRLKEVLVQEGDEVATYEDTRKRFRDGTELWSVVDHYESRDEHWIAQVCIVHNDDVGWTAKEVRRFGADSILQMAWHESRWSDQQEDDLVTLSPEHA